MKNHGWVLPVAFALVCPAAHAARPEAELPLAQAGAPASGPRLIETAAGQRAWMTADEVSELSAQSHAEGHCGGFMDVTEHARKPTRPALGFYDVAGYPDPQHAEQVNAIVAKLSVSELTHNVDVLSHRFKNRFLRAQTGAAAAQWIRDRYLELAHGRADVTAELVAHKKFIQPSVIVRIAGQGPHADERVILGAHEDSVNWQTGNPSSDDLAPGADDDASGITTLIEAFRVLMESDFRPDRTVEFMAYAGEELGLLGSQDIAERYADQKIAVVGVQQFDMTFYPTAHPEIGMISDHTRKALNQYTEKLLDTYVKVRWRETPCGYACSDHASWTAAGFASSFPFESSDGEGNPKIHTVKDTLDILSPDFGMHFAKLAVAFAYELGNP